MPIKNSTQQQEINRRRQLVSKLRHEGVRGQAEITERLKTDYGIDVTQQTVSNDLKALNTLWRQSAIENVDKWKKEVADQYRYLYQQSLAAWELSLEDAEEVTFEKTQSGESLEPIEKKKIKGQSGNPAHIRNAQDALEAIRKLLGLDAKNDPGSSADNPFVMKVIYGERTNGSSQEPTSETGSGD